MKDKELRDIVLQYFYDRRREGELDAPQAADLGIEIDQRDIFRACSQLREQKLLHWKNFKTTLLGPEIIVRSGKITVFGVDTVEGNDNPATKMESVQHTNMESVQRINNINIIGPANVIAGNSITGNNNTLTLSGLEKVIESVDATPQKKKEEKTLLNKLLGS